MNEKDKRKLQSEIDRCIKKVQEGMVIFDEIWEKVNEANNANQKEKVEAELKKEIKKLQRLRDQIKGWQNSNEIKDKSLLQEYRLLIEGKMEQFKVIERENRMKAYSNRGLHAEHKIDPKEKEKEDTIEWLQDCIDRLNQQNDVFESEMEQLLAIGGKKKKLDKEKQDKLDQLKKHIENHKFHVSKLELLLRLLNNDSIDSTQVLIIKDDLEHYIENHQEADFEENKYIYDDLELGEIEQLAQQLHLAACFGDDMDISDEDSNTAPSISPSVSPVSSHAGEKELDDARFKIRRLREEIIIVKPLVTRALSTSAIRTPQIGTPLKFKSHTSTESGRSTSPVLVTPPPALPGIPYSSVAAGTRSMSAPKSLSINNRTSSELAIPTLEFTSTKPTAQPSSPPTIQPQSTPNGHREQPIKHRSPSTPVVQECSPSSNAVSPDRPLRKLEFYSTTQPVGQLRNYVTVDNDFTDSEDEIESMLQEVVTTATSPPDIINSSFKPITTLVSPETELPPPQDNGVLENGNIETGILHNPIGLSYFGEDQGMKISVALGASALGKVHLDAEQKMQLSMLDAARHHLPFPVDSERLRHYFPRSPCQTPSYYPQGPLPIAETVDYFAALTPETLFFIFYYMDGTRAQYLAAEALDKKYEQFYKEKIEFRCDF